MFTFWLLMMDGLRLEEHEHGLGFCAPKARVRAHGVRESVATRSPPPCDVRCCGARV